MTSTPTKTPFKAPPLQCTGHTRPIPSLTFSRLQPDSSYFLLSSCKDSKPMLRDGITGDWIGTFLGHKGAVWAAKLSGDSSKAITGSADFTAKIWNAYSGECVRTLTHEHIVRGVDITESASHGITGGYEKKIRVYDLEREDAAPELLRKDGSDLAHDAPIKAVAFVNEDRREAVSAGDDNAIRWWDLRTGSLTQTIPTPGAVTSLERSHDASLISVTTDKTVAFYDPSNRQSLHSHTFSYPITTASLHPIRRDRFVTGSTDGRVRVHDAASGEELETLKGHFGPVHSIAFSPDGELYASGSEDGTIRLWQDSPKSYGLWRHNPVNGADAEAGPNGVNGD